MDVEIRSGWLAERKLAVSASLFVSPSLGSLLTLAVCGPAVLLIMTRVYQRLESYVLLREKYRLNGADKRENDRTACLA